MTEYAECQSCGRDTPLEILVEYDGICEQCKDREDQEQEEIYSREDDY